MPGGRNIVVGTYIYSLLLGMSVPDISGRAMVNLGLSDLRALVLLQVSGFGQDGPMRCIPVLPPLPRH